MVARRDHGGVVGMNGGMEPYGLVGEGLLARAICHECDHLKGKLYVSMVEGELKDTDAMDEEEESEE